MRSMKKLLQKVVVFTLTAAMLVGTPLTASAAPLNEVFKVTNPWDETLEQNGPDDTRTGTVTGTATSTGVLRADSQITGITLSETNVEIDMEGAYDGANLKTKVLEVEIDWVGEKDAALEKKLQKRLKWVTGDRDIVALQGMAVKENDGNEKMTLVAKAGGKTTVTVSLNSEEHNIHYSATADVTVKQSASKLSFSPDLVADAYEGASLTLDEYLVKDPATATDTVSYVIKQEDVKGSATLKKGVLTLKSGTKYQNKKLTVVAVGDKVAGEQEITIKKAVPATNVQITCTKEGFINGKKADWLINTLGTEVKLGVTVSPDNCTDKVTWTSQKPGVVALKYNNPKNGKEGVTLTAKSVGTSKITAKAGKKSATLTVTVRANLTEAEITTGKGTLYSGQTIQLAANQYFGKNNEDKTNGNFTDAGLNWAFAGTSAEVKAMKKVAGINAKTGVLTIEPNLGVNGGTDKIKIKVQNAKKVGKATDEPGYVKKAKGKDYGSPVEFKLEQINVKSITVYSNTYTGKDAIVIAGASLKDGVEGKPQDLKNQKTPVNIKGNNTVNIANGASRTYKVVVAATDKEGKAMDPVTAAKAVGWVSSSTKVATVSAGNGNGIISALKKGKSTITVSSATKKGTGYVAIKATFKANVTVPTKSIKLTAKNPAIAYKDAKQSVKITAKLDKGTTNKTKEIIWSAKKTSVASGKTEVVNASDIKGGTLKLAKGDYAAGDEYAITAKLPGTGLQTTIRLKVVKATNKVQIVQNAESTERFKNKKTDINLTGTDNSLALVTKVQTKGDVATKWTVAGSDNYAGVTYTLKGDSVRLVGNTIYAVKLGKTTITAKTADGKTDKLTVTVVAPAAAQ